MRAPTIRPDLACIHPCLSSRTDSRPDMLQILKMTSSIQGKVNFSHKVSIFSFKQVVLAKLNSRRSRILAKFWEVKRNHLAANFILKSMNYLGWRLG